MNSIAPQTHAISKILEARKTGVLLSGLDAREQPQTLEDGYIFQEEAIEQWDDEVAGWKVGATSAEIQELFGISTPVYGPIFKRGVFRSPARIPAGLFPHRLLESEFAFRFGRDLQPRSKPYVFDEIISAVDALLPAIEVVSPRFNALTVHHIPQLVADFCGSGGAVLGDPCENWRTLNLPSHTVTFAVDRTERQRGTGEIVLGNPLNALVWFVNALTRRGKGVFAGQFVMTGSMTGLHAVEPSRTARADFGTLGAVELEFG